MAVEKGQTGAKEVPSSAARETASDPDFERELRRVLHNLYDPSVLRASPLRAVLGVQEHEGLSGLQRILTEAIRALKPHTRISSQSSAWRVYRTLSDRFIDQFSQQEVALGLNLSIRQMKRQESQALQVLADYLWTHHRLGERWRGAGQLGSAAAPQPAGASSQQEELAWLERSSRDEAAELSAVLQSLLSIATPLAAALGVDLEHDLPASLPRTALQPMPIRQAILCMLTAAIHAVPGGSVVFRAELVRGDVRVQIEATASSGGPRPLPVEETANLELARRLVSLAGGALEVQAPAGEEPAFSGCLLLPAARPVAVLVIDDNADTLQLVQRYLAGSRYAFVGLRDPNQVLAMAAELRPQIIVLDVMLPGIDGWELLGRLREHLQTRNIPVIICSILWQEHLALSLGAAAYIHKPVNREALLAALDRQLGRPPPDSA